MLKYKTYSENIRAACRDLGGISIRQLSIMTGYTYEHVRRIYSGKAAAGEECNAIVCQALKLPIDEMWELAKMEKAAAKLGYRPPRLMDPEGQRLSKVWSNLSEDHRRTVMQVVEGLLMADRVPA